MNHARYTRLYADDAGESHFEDLETELAPTDFAPPAAPLNVASFLPATGTLWVGGPKDWAGEAFHPAPRRQIFCTTVGEFRVTASDGETRSFPVGSVLVLDDTHGKGHSTSIPSDGGALVLGIAIGDE